MLTPPLTALMCDGMGSFSDVDYKRMLLAFDRIDYLLPAQRDLVEFRDVTGRAAHFLLPARLYAETTAFTPCTYDCDEQRQAGLQHATAADLSADALRTAVSAIPPDELLYTWRLVNSDGGLAGGRSPTLGPDQMPAAHLLLLNKFLLAAEARDSIPITGQAYVHELLTLKYRHAAAAIAQHLPDTLPLGGREWTLRQGPFVAAVISAFVSDTELAARSVADVIEYKRRHQELFDRFSVFVRELAKKLASLPSEDRFAADVRDVLAVDVWKAQDEVRRDMRSAWEALFVDGIKESLKSDTLKTTAKVASSALAIGVLPHLSPGALTWGSALAAGGAVAPWIVTELVGLLTQQRKARQHGLYYLLGFAR